MKYIEKIKKKNIIVGYVLVDDNSNKITVDALQLKRQIKAGKVKVENLTLTSDNRLVDKANPTKTNFVVKDKPTKTLEEVVPDKNKQKYLAQKTKSKRVGLAVKKCLLIGLASASLASTVTACGIDNTSYALSSEQKELSADDAIAMINNASELNVDTKNFKLAKTFVIMSNGQEVAEAKGKVIKLYDSIVLKTNTDEEIAEGKQNVTALFDKYTITDKDGNEIFYMKQKLNLLFTSFTLYDSNDNYIGKIKGDDLGSKSAKIVDKDGNVIAEIKAGTLRNDFTIIFSDDCKMDKVGITSASCNYIATVLNDSQSHGHSSSSKKG